MDFVEQLKSQIDIVRVVGEYVRLQKAGNGRYKGLCPFHTEKTASFTVNHARQRYHCFGCSADGDAIKFVMELDGLTFPEALKLLAERNGIPMPKRNEYSDADSKLRGALLEMHEIAAQMYRTNLAEPQGSEAQAYLDRRGVSQELIEVFGLGFADPSGQALLRRLGEQNFTQAQLEASGLVRKRNEGPGYYDYFRGRLMFPIHNEAGKVIAFGGRGMRDEDQPKYLNSPETPVYKKTSVLYNLHRARDGMRKSGRAVLVEGYMDVIGIYAAGVNEAVASCGTALTNAQVRTIHRHADTVALNFDPDNAGMNAAERAIQLLLDEGLHIRVVTLEEGLDPDEYVKKFGAETYRAKLDSAGGYFYWLADRARAKFDMRSAEGRMEAYKFLLPAVLKVSDRLERAAIASDVASYLGVDPSLVLNQFKKAPNDRTPVPQSRTNIPAGEKILLNALLASSQARSEILPSLPAAITEGFVTREIFDGLRKTGISDLPVTFDALEGRLSEEARVLLHTAMAADEIGDEESSLEQAQACVRRLRLDYRKRHIDELRAQVKSAEREGRVKEALSLTAELEREVRELRSDAV